jgi:hypothetical protein
MEESLLDKGILEKLTREIDLLYNCQQAETLNKP